VWGKLYILIGGKHLQPCISSYDPEMSDTAAETATAVKIMHACKL